MRNHRRDDQEGDKDWTVKKKKSNRNQNEILIKNQTEYQNEM